MRSAILALTLVVGVVASTASAQTIYDNFRNAQGGPTVECGSFGVQSCADDMVVANGGQLTSFKYRFFNAGGDFFGGSETQSWDIALLLDDGDGLPDASGATDTILYSNSYVNESILFSTEYEGTEALFASNINVAPGDKIWGVVTGLGFNMHLGLNDVAPSVGTTDNQFYRFGSDFNDTTAAQPNSGWQLQLNAIVPEPASLTLVALGAIALLRRRRN